MRRQMPAEGSADGDAATEGDTTTTAADGDAATEGDTATERSSGGADEATDGHGSWKNDWWHGRGWGDWSWNDDWRRQGWHDDWWHGSSWGRCSRWNRRFSHDGHNWKLDIKIDEWWEKEYGHSWGKDDGEVATNDKQAESEEEPLPFGCF